MKKRALSLLLCCCMVLGFGPIPAPTVEARAEEMELVEEGYCDEYVIPDPYNTGIEDGIVLQPVKADATLGTVAEEGDAITISYLSTSGYYCINSYANGSMAYEVLIEGYDFCDFYVLTTNIERYEDPKTITFKNCRFNGFRHANDRSSNLSFVFENCTFISTVNGSNMSFNKCSFIGNDIGSDGMMAFCNIEVNDCYFYGFPQTNSSGTHTDGVQIAGNNNLSPSNAHFNNVRFEMPVIQGNGGYINAPIMVSLDYADADNISFTNCIANGGGYSIYAAENEFQLTNTNFENISVGAGRLYGMVYPSVGEDVSMTNVYETERLYVSSVWKDDTNKIHVITTNDTTTDRTLVIATDTGVEEHIIECKATAEANGAATTEEIPIDVEIILDDSEYIVCYDTSVSAENQIRFVNFGANQIYRKSDGTHVLQEVTTELVAEGVYDTQVIPDKYNTGIEAGVTLTPYAEYFSGYCNDGESLYITQALQNNLGTVYENIEFSSVVTLNKANLTSMVFRNCKFSASAAYAVNTGSNLDSENVTVTFENCEFLNQTSACVQPTKNFKLVNCKIHDMGSDGGKVLDNGSYENCYFYNIGFADGAHADGIQVTSNNDNFSIINCRFDMPTYNEYMANAAIFFILEEDSTNSVVKDCFAYGGNYSVYYGRKTPDAETPVALENNTVENIIVGCGYQYGAFNDNSNSFDYSEIKDADKLFVSSVWKDGETIHLLASNYTNEERVLKVVSDTGTKSVTIPAAPTYEEGKDYTDFSQFPFDVEIETTGDYVVCYDTEETAENQIRFVNYSGAPVYRMITSGAGDNTGNNGNGSVTEGSTIINVKVITTEVNVTVPLNATCIINPNEEVSFVHSDLIVTNNSKVPVTLSIGNFSQGNADKICIHPDDLENVTGKAEWNDLSLEESKTYFAVGIKPQAGENWQEVSATEYAYADTEQKVVQGTIKPESSVMFDLTAEHGFLFTGRDYLAFQLVFVAELAEGEMGGNITPSVPDDTTNTTQSGTWQLKTTTDKKYVILGTDDDNAGNAKFFRLLRSYDFPYTMNVEAENVNPAKEMGSDVDDTIFTEEDAPALFPDGVDVVTLGKYIHESGLGEVAQHGISKKTLWNSDNLTGTVLDEIYSSYTANGGAMTEEEVRNEIVEQLAYTDIAQGAQYVVDSKKTLEAAYGFPIYTVGIWGGTPVATIEGIEYPLSKLKNGNYNWRENGYLAAAPSLSFVTNKSVYDLPRLASHPSNVLQNIEKIELGKACEFFWHMPFNDEPDISQWRTLLSSIKAMEDAGEIEVVTRKQYAELGEYVDNPVTSITLTRNGHILLGTIDEDDAYMVVATYADGSTSDVSDEAIVDRSSIDTNIAGKYTVSATYRGFNTTVQVSVVDMSYTVPEGLKDTEYWFIAKNETQNKLIAGNTTNMFGSVGASSKILCFLGCGNGTMNGWVSSDNGSTWVQVNTDTEHSKNIKTAGTDTVVRSLFNFGSAANDSFTWLETSGNFEITYNY